MINVHASLLPRWRGAAPIIYAILNGDQTTGVSIMRIRPKSFDIGEVRKRINRRPEIKYKIYVCPVSDFEPSDSRYPAGHFNATTT